MSLGILITYYNEGELLTRSIRAMLDEKFPPEEILIYDDCSEKPASQFIPEEAVDRVKVFHGTVNKGPACGRNFLLSQSKADFVKFHDADDVLRKGWSEKVRSRLVGDNPDVLLLEVDSITDQGVKQERVIGLWEIAQGKDPVSFAIGHAIVTSSALYRRDFLEKTGGYREDLWQSEDHEFHIRVLSCHPQLSLLTESILDLHVRSQSRSQKFLEVWRCRLQGLKMAKQYLPPKYYQDLCDAAAEVGGILFQLGDTQNAGDAFVWARSLATPRYASRPFFYRWLARWNPLWAESFGKHYRSLLPASIRRALRG